MALPFLVLVLGLSNDLVDELMNDLTNEENSKSSQDLEIKALDIAPDNDQKPDPETSSQERSQEPKGQHKLRIGLLSIFVGGALLILGRSLFDGNIGKPTAFTNF